jgi:hypothetical protein
MFENKFEKPGQWIAMSDPKLNLDITQAEEPAK